GHPVLLAVALGRPGPVRAGGGGARVPRARRVRRIGGRGIDRPRRLGADGDEHGAARIARADAPRVRSPSVPQARLRAGALLVPRMPNAPPRGRTLPSVAGRTPLRRAVRRRRWFLPPLGARAKDARGPLGAFARLPGDVGDGSLSGRRGLPSHRAL